MKISYGNRKLKFILVFAFLFLVCLAQFLPAQSYLFQVPQLKLQVYVQPEGSVLMLYDISFANHDGAHPIDVVDIGLPHKDYDISNMTAWIGDTALTDIRPSTYVKPGVEIHLKNKSIPAGQSGTFHFKCEMPGLIFQDTTREDYASLVITPTWFGRKYVMGRGTILIAVHMLPGIKAEEMLYHKGSPFSKKAIYEDRVVAVWQFRGSATKPYKVGVSFPKEGLDYVIKLNLFERVARKLEYNTDLRLLAGAILVLLFTGLFFRFSGGTGCSVYVVLLAGLIFLCWKSPLVQVLGFPVIIVLFVLNELTLRRTRRIHYMPAVAKVEAGKVRRGLSPAEAAVLLELPLGKVLSIVIFGLLKKGVVELVSTDPFTVRVAEPFREKESFRQMRKVARKKGLVLKKYEQGFLDALQRNPDKAIADIDFQYPMKDLIEHTVSCVNAFDPKATRKYYKDMVSHALREIGSIQNKDERWEATDKHMEWVLCGEDYQDLFNFHGYSYIPPWLRWDVLRDESIAEEEKEGISFRPYHGRYSDNWLEDLFNQTKPAIDTSSLKLQGANEGVVDLSGFDRVTGDVFEALSKGGGGSGGGGCACAGCACACACAGGGR